MTKICIKGICVSVILDEDYLHVSFAFHDYLLPYNQREFPNTGTEAFYGNIEVLGSMGEASLYIIDFVSQVQLVMLK